MKAFALALTMLFSLSAFASKVPQAELDNVNAHLAKMMENSGDILKNLIITVESADRNDETKLLEELQLNFDFMGIEFSMGVQAKDDLINVNGGISASMANLGMTAEDLLGLLPEIQKYVDEVNAQGVYKAEMTVTEVPEAKVMEIMMLPVTQDSTNSVVSIKTVVVIPADVAANPLTLNMDAIINAGSDNVMKAQGSLSGIFNALAVGQEPSEEDMKTLAELLSQIFPKNA